MNENKKSLVVVFFLQNYSFELIINRKILKVNITKYLHFMCRKSLRDNINSKIKAIKQMMQG